MVQIKRLGTGSERNVGVLIPGYPEVSLSRRG